MITTSSEWDSLAQRAGGETTLVARLYYGAEGASDYISLADRDGIEIAGETFLAALSDVPPVVQNLNYLTHEHSISELVLTLDNLVFETGGRRISDLWEDTAYGTGADTGFENRKIELRLYIPGITSFANCFPLMEYGAIRDPGDQDRERMTLEIEDRSALAEAELGTVVADSDAADGQNLPEESAGKIFPKIFGDHRLNLGHLTKASWTADRRHNGVPALYLGVDTSGRHRWQLSDHQLENMVTDESDSDPLWMKDTVIKRLVKLAAFTVEQNDANGCIISHAELETLYDYVFPDGTQSNRFENNGPTSTDEGYAYDLDAGSPWYWVCPDSAGVLGTRITIQFDIDFPAYSPPVPDADISDVRLFAAGTFDEGLSAHDGAEGSQYLLEGTNIKAITSGTFMNVKSEGGDQAGAEGDVTVFAAGSWNDPAPDVNAGRIYETFKRVEYTPPVRYQLYSCVQGREYGTWVNGRSTGEGYDDDHDDDDGSGNLIRNAIGLLESVLRDDLNLGDTEIDRNALNTASTLIPATVSADYLASSSMTKLTKARDFLVGLARDFRFWFWWQTDGTVKAKVIEDTYAASDLIIDAREFQGLKFKRTKIRDLKTAVKVLHSWNGEIHMSDTGISEDTTQQSRYNVTEQQSTLIHRAFNFRNTTTAGLIRTFLKNFRKLPHNRAVGTLGRAYLHLDIGDMFELSNTQFDAYGEDVTGNVTRSAQTIYKYFIIFHIEKSKNIYLEALQLHRLD